MRSRWTVGCSPRLSGEGRGPAETKIRPPSPDTLVSRTLRPSSFLFGTKKHFLRTDLILYNNIHPSTKYQKIAKSKNMPWKVLEDDTMCQAAERNPEKALRM